MSFKRWVTAETGREESPGRWWPAEELGSVRYIDTDNLLAAIQTGGRYLDNAFQWRSSPQGHSYWRDRAEGVVPLSDEDVDFLEALYLYHTA